MRGSDLCAAHHLDYQERRRAGAQRGGRARGIREIAEIKSEIKAVIEAVKAGALDRGVGAVVFQGYNTLLRAIEVARRGAEADEYRQRIEDLERRIRSHAG